MSRSRYNALNPTPRPSPCPDALATTEGTFKGGVAPFGNARRLRRETRHSRWIHRNAQLLALQNKINLHILDAR
ncbi:MAG: hypothetical protein KME30_05900 [Iphinoe sp. HA4291-MV1]|jgi:hypothetical protein|nr:hypothetical protein [Iphinoe sp. HA4291-MV1]